MTKKRSVSEVFVDVCTQRDYLHEEGAKPVLNLHDVRRNIKHLMAFARLANVPVLSCAEIRRPKDVIGAEHPDCVFGTTGQQKPLYTVMPDHLTVDSDNSLSISLDILKEHHQAILMKSERDPFTNPKFDRLLTEMPTKHFVIFGVSLEYTIRMLTLGLHMRHRDAIVIPDACGYWDKDEAEMVLRQLEVKEVKLINTADFLRDRAARRFQGKGHFPRHVA